MSRFSNDARYLPYGLLFSKKGTKRTEFIVADCRERDQEMVNSFSFIYLIIEIARTTVNIWKPKKTEGPGETYFAERDLPKKKSIHKSANAFRW